MEMDLQDVIRIADDYRTRDDEFCAVVDLIIGDRPSPQAMTLDDFKAVRNANYHDLLEFFRAVAGAGCAEAEEVIELVRRIRDADNPATRIKLRHDGALTARWTVVVYRRTVADVKDVIAACGTVVDDAVETANTATLEIRTPESVTHVELRGAINVMVPDALVAIAPHKVD